MYVALITKFKHIFIIAIKNCEKIKMILTNTRESLLDWIIKIYNTILKTAEHPFSSELSIFFTFWSAILDFEISSDES